MSTPAGTDGFDQALLGEGSVTRYLCERGLVAHDAKLRARRLSGGVSNVVLLVEGDQVPAPGLVVKQSLERLNVPEPWIASRRRTRTEGMTLRIAGQITPGRVPAVIDLDTDRLVLVIEAAPPGWASLKDELMAGRVDVVVSGELGAALAAWHNATAGSGQERDWADAGALRQLRTDPYHRATMERNRGVVEPLQDCIDELEGTQACLVHGDFSPKNIMVGRTGWWVLDFEAAHVGAPVFDVAFFTCHLLLKAVHRPEHHDAYHAASTALWEAYARSVSHSLLPPDDRLVLHTACLLLARVDGRSPAEYLDDARRHRVRDIAVDVLRQPVRDLQQLWQRLNRA